jgi:hypothetical protein
MNLKIFSITSISIFFFGCIFSKNDVESKTFQFTGQGVLDISEINEEEGYFVTSRNDTWCNDSILEQKTYNDTTFYEISNEELYFWDNRDECYATKFIGNSSSIKGTWSSNNNEDFMVKKASPYAEFSECQKDYIDYEKEDYQLNYIDDFNSKLKISENMIDQNMDWDICLARFNYFDFVNGAEYKLGSLDTNINIFEKSCSEFNVKIGTKEANVQFKTLDLDSRSDEGKYLVTFNYGGKSCETIGKSILRPMPNSDADCIENIENEVQEDVNWNEFRKCVKETGFYTSRTSGSYELSSTTKSMRMKNSMRILF